MHFTSSWNSEVEEKRERDKEKIADLKLNKRRKKSIHHMRERERVNGMFVLVF